MNAAEFAIVQRLRDFRVHGVWVAICDKTLMAVAEIWFGTECRSVIVEIGL
ncbi:MAG: hypothetical protein WC730_02010 [Patescibacteria group bacterium]